MRLQSARLILRPWQEHDRAPFARINADSEVRRYFPSILSRAESDDSIDRMRARWDRDGFAFGVAERAADGAFVGMIGLQRVDTGPLAGTVEIGWRLDRLYWGRGYATEGAEAWLRHAFGPLALAEVVAFTPVPNLPSQAVMRRLNMRRAAERDFDHPAIAPDHPLAHHVVHAISAGDFNAA